MWLLQEETARSMQRAMSMQIVPTAAQLEALTERAQAAAPRNMTIAGSTAEIRVSGVLTKQPDFFAMYFGGGNTSYTDIIAAFALAKSDASVKDAVLVVDSPGGAVDGLFDALAAIEDFKAAKKLRVRAANALSAAYAIAAAGGKIEATGPHASFGSIGIAGEFRFASDVITVTVTNTDSPDKRPDVQTPEGKAVVVKYLDAVNDLFVDAIARGRGTSKDSVTAEFGRGATMLASEAKRRGMIDAIAKPALRAVVGGNVEMTDASAASGGIQGDPMDLKTLKAQHADVYEAAVADGMKQERDRVVAHLNLGAKGGPEGLVIATAHIKSGEGMSLTAQSEYIGLAMNLNSVKSRQEESDAAAVVTAGAAGVVTPETAAAPKKDIGDLVADRIAPLAQKAG